MRRIALRGAVRDLAFLEAGEASAPALLAATTLDFYRIEGDGRAKSISPGPGSKARQVTRIAVAPGLIETSMTAELPREVLDKAVEETALGRVGQPEDVAREVVSR